jgi:hypothetical protein
MRHVRSLTVLALCLVPLLTACHHPQPTSSSTTIVVPPEGSHTLVCQDGRKPPCYEADGTVIVCRDGSKPPCK